MRKQTDTRLSRRTLLATTVAGLGLMARPLGLRAETPRRSDIRAIAFDGAALILAADGYWRSRDGGTSWSRLTDGGHGAGTALATHPDRPGRIQATLAAGGVIRSVDGGVSWKRVGTNLPADAATALTVAAPAPDTLYLAMQGDGLWRSLDAGDTWEFVMDRPFLGGAEREVLTLASVNGSTGMGGIWLYAGTERGLTRVPDCFCRWQDVQPGDAMDALAAGAAPTPGNPLPAGEPLRSLALAPRVPDVLYAALPSGIWKSTSAGVSWTKAGNAVVQCLAVNPNDPNHVVAATAGPRSWWQACDPRSRRPIARRREPAARPTFYPRRRRHRGAKQLSQHLEESRADRSTAIQETEMKILSSTALATAATLAFFGIAHTQDAAAQGHVMGAATMPEACMAGAPGMPGHDTMSAPTGNLSEHQAAMMQGMMAMSDQMMQSVMAEDPDVAFACGMIPHHQAAIDMAEAELEFGDDPDMKAMAQAIIDAQTREIEQLATWIEEHAQ